jgi:hypothetical protein
LPASQEPARQNVPPAFPSRPPLQDPIETMRGLAVLLLVSFHVIGAASNAGLQLDYPHPLRLFADLLIDLLSRCS